MRLLSMSRCVQAVGGVTLMLAMCLLLSYKQTDNSVAGKSASKLNVTAIPKILHQTWDTERVPMTFYKWMVSWLRLHPQWEYWFWTESDVHHLIKKHYPKYLSVYENYKGSIFRSDAMRYFVLYHYGGVYADLDVEALRPLDDLLVQHECLLTYETNEHAIFLYEKTTPVVMTTIMAAQPGHPFFKMAMETLPQTAQRKDVMDATGPFFINHVYLKYIKQEQKSSITVLDSKYLLPTFDSGWLHHFQLACQQPTSDAAKKLCDWHEFTNWRNEPRVESYTNHHWCHVVIKDPSWKKKDTFHIDTVFPNRRNLLDVIYGIPRTTNPAKSTNNMIDQDMDIRIQTEGLNQ